MATKNYTFPSDSSGGNDYQPDLTDTADIAVAFADFVEGIQSVFNSIGSDTSFIDNKLDGTTDLSVPASRFILQGTQSINNIKFAVTNTGSITLNLPPATTTIVGTDSSQTLTNKTLSTATISGTTTLTGTVNASGATVSSPTITSPTISNPTITGSVTGDQDFNNNVNVDGNLTVVGTVQAGSTNVTALTVNGSQIVGGYIPVPGMIVMYNGTTPPAGWAICNGTNGTPDLRDRFIIGSGSSFGLGATGGGYGTGGAGDHHHNLPRFNGSFNTNESGSVHYHTSDPGGFTSGSSGSHSHNSSTGTSNSNSTRAVGNTGGVAAPAHTHNFNTGSDGSHTHNVNVPAFNSGNASANHAHSGSFTTDELPVKVTASSPGNHAHSTDRPLFYALMYIMKL
jgi:hypothetical protein